MNYSWSQGKKDSVIPTGNWTVPQLRTVLNVFCVVCFVLGFLLKRFKSRCLYYPTHRDLFMSGSIDLNLRNVFQRREDDGSKATEKLFIYLFIYSFIYWLIDWFFDCSTKKWTTTYQVQLKFTFLIIKDCFWDSFQARKRPLKRLLRLASLRHPRQNHKYHRKGSERLVRLFCNRRKPPIAGIYGTFGVFPACC